MSGMSEGQHKKINCFTGNRACNLTSTPSTRKLFNILIILITDRFSLMHAQMGDGFAAVYVK